MTTINKNIDMSIIDTDTDVELDTDVDTDTSNSDSSTCLELSDEDLTDIEDTVHLLLCEYITDNPLLYSKKHFIETLECDIMDGVISILTDNHSVMGDYNSIVDAVKCAFTTFFLYNKYNIIPRSQNNASVTSSMGKTYIDTQIKHLLQLPQPEQKSQEWYKYRHGLITASNIYKAFASQSQINSLIYEKCKPFVEREITNNNWGSVSSLQWGVLYEPVSVLLYEYLNSTNISDFGCIQHEKYNYIGASPDGINTNPNSKLYGRMIEIKNIVNRDITGIPKEEYWVQTQIQMETCGLDECDFIETRFKEYDDVDNFYTDITKQRGIILCFVENCNSNSSPVYVYSKMDLTIESDIVNKWIEYEKELKSDKFMLLKSRYWYLDEYSCVLIKRNAIWFNAALPMIKSVWDTIVKEREYGYEHRAPKKKNNKQCLFVSMDNNDVTTTRTINIIPPKTNLSIVKI